ncbi:hypothetical protein PbB2_01203 [Candidatus Phycosocius bacilliformis]|uniref:DUF2336 domain-containing protein n=1 Tax=Candidatus Phycosocius bacilliformis TaxID=1445552 RepID=A0A2P2E8Z2_9PROT|nr:hypothetical protein PbB2_01203 [Candidatus Phycosocius bacilliformis]
MRVGERYSKLLEVASESSSEKRRELLNEVTDLFFDSQDNQSPVETKLFGDLIAKVAYELDSEVRKQLANRFSGGEAPRSLAVAMANDSEIGIAGPILRRSTSLTQDDLIRVVETRGHEHQMVVTQRPDVGEQLSEALVVHGDDRVVASLVSNQTAKVSDETFDKIVDRAAKNPDLHRPIAERKVISPEHLNRLYTIVEGPMRREILERNAEFTEEEVERAMRRAQTRVAVVNGTLPADFEKVQAEYNKQKGSNAINRSQLPSLWRNHETTKFMIAFADLTGLDYFQTALLFEKKDIDTMAMVCRAANFERALFVTIAVLVLGNEGLSQAEVLGNMYNDVPPEAAQRAIRFMRLRATVTAQAA